MQLVAAVDKIVTMQTFNVPEALIVLAERRCCLWISRDVQLRVDSGVDDLTESVNPNLGIVRVVGQGKDVYQRFDNIVAELLNGDTMLLNFAEGIIANSVQHANGNA